MTLKGSVRYAAGLLALGSATAAMAAPLIPGTSNGLLGGTADGWIPGVAGSLEFDSGPFTSLSSFFHGTFDTAVHARAGGTLDFYFRISNDFTSTDPISRLTAINFGTFSTYDVEFRSDLGGVAPVLATRSASGSIVGFEFDGDGLLPGTTSAWMYIATDARSYHRGSTSLINGDIATMDSWAPAATPVPEPFTMGLAGLGLAAAYRRRKAR